MSQYTKYVTAETKCDLSRVEVCYQRDDADSIINALCKIRLQFRNCSPVLALSTYCDATSFEYRSRNDGYRNVCTSKNIPTNTRIYKVEGYIEVDQVILTDETDDVSYPTGFKFFTREGKAYSFGQVIPRRRFNTAGLLRGLITAQSAGNVDGNLIGITFDSRGYMDWFKFRFQDEKTAEVQK